MYRKVVSLFLLPCVLLTQSVAVIGHAHGGHQPAGHDLRPHVHTSLASARHHHGHHHHGPGGHRHHHHGGHASAALDSQPSGQPQPLSGGEHDSDAVYIDQVAAIINSRSMVDDTFGALLACAVAGGYLQTNFRADPPREAVPRTHEPPPPRGYACPLYLWQLTLLI